MNISLTPNDVPGAEFVHPEVEQHSVLQLKRWLECRGLQKTGNKAALIERCKSCIKAGRDQLIAIGVDGGKWYEIKQHQLAKPSSTISALPSTSKSTAVPTHHTDNTQESWKPFPSVQIPTMFNKGHIYVYLVLNAPTIAHSSSEEESDDASDMTTEKPFKRGQQFVDSGFVNKIFDKKTNSQYVLKCCVNSSYKKKVHYNVSATLCAVSGSVLSCKCECKQSAGNRCSHIAAALLFLWKHVQEHGYDAITCTSRPQQWGLGSKNKKPAALGKNAYATALRMKPLERCSFNPRPTNYEKNVDINEFISNLEQTGIDSMFLSLFRYVYHDFTYDSQELNVISEQCLSFHKNMFDYVFQNNDIVVELKDTLGQSNNDRWFNLRRNFITASNAKAVVHFQTDSAKKNYIKNHLWHLEESFISTAAMRYGLENEKNARECYRKLLSKNESVVESGLVMNRKYSFLGCSVDGIVLDENLKQIKLLEIKCPYVLKDCDPHEFKNKLSKKQLASFALTEENGIYNVKQNHTYYCQMQICMLIHEIDVCDFVVWSKYGIIKVEVAREKEDSNYMKNCVTKIKKFYNNIYVPEMFCMRVPRNLSPINMELC